MEKDKRYGGLKTSVFGRWKMQDTGIRINKYLSEAGVCSRREADRQIEAGNVTIDGKTAVMGDRIFAGQQVFYMGKPVAKEEEMILLAVNKPAGIVCTAQKREKNNIVDFVHYPKRIYPVGRLDKDSEGLILMTNNGEIVNKMMRAGNMHGEGIHCQGQPGGDGTLFAWNGKWCSAKGTERHNQEMPGGETGETQIPYYSDPGTEPSDPQNV